MYLLGAMARKHLGKPLTLAVFLGCFSLMMLLAAAQTGSPENSWPMFRGSPALDGVSTTSLAAPLKLRWSYQAKDSIESSAAIIDGTVYIGSYDGFLYAIDLATGKVRWQYQTTEPVQESSPCVHDGIVYVGDLAGTLHAVDAADGKVRWTFKTGGEIKSSPVWMAGRIYFGSYDQQLYCLEAAGGKLVWKYETDGPVHCTPSFYQDKVYISGCDENFRAIDAATGKQLYAMPLGAYAGASAAVLGNFAYVGTFGNEILAIDLKQRTVQWVYRHASRNFPFYSSAALTPSYVVIGGRDKLVHCLERSTGEEVWTYTTGGRVESSPLITGNRVFVGSNDGNLYELNLATGKKVWEFVAGAPLSASPAAAQGALVIGSQDGVLYCFGQ